MLQKWGDVLDTTASVRFDSTLVQGVRQFRSRHGLKEVDAIDDAMVDVLNVPPDERVRQLLINMERLRWMPDQPKGEFLLVFDADFIPEPDTLERVVKNAGILVDAAKILGVPVVTTEQYPKGVGPTTADIARRLCGLEALIGGAFDGATRHGAGMNSGQPFRVVVPEETEGRGVEDAPRAFVQRQGAEDEIGLRNHGKQFRHGLDSLAPLIARTAGPAHGGDPDRCTDRRRIYGQPGPDRRGCD